MRGNAQRATELAFEGLGGVKRLTTWAKANPTEFYTKIWIKLMPQQTMLSNPDGSPLQIKLVNYADANNS